MALWKMLISMRIGLLLFLLLALAGFVGSIIPQGHNKYFYIKNFGQVKGSIITHLGLDGLFSSPWFILPGLLFGLNLTACSFQRLRLLLARPSWKRAGSCALHFGIIMVIIGGSVSFNDKQQVYVEAVAGEVKHLGEAGFPFDLKVLGFDIDYFPNMQPKQYRTRVQAVKEGSVQKEYEISVNHPFKYSGINIYQTGYGWVIGGEIKGPAGEELVTWREGLHRLSDDPLLMVDLRFYPHYAYDRNCPVSLSQKPHNPRIVCSMYDSIHYLGHEVLAPGQSVSRQGYTFGFRNYSNYTGLEIKRDRGVPYVWTGFLLVMTGIMTRYLGGRVKSSGYAGEEEG